MLCHYQTNKYIMWCLQKFIAQDRKKTNREKIHWHPK